MTLDDFTASVTHLPGGRGSSGPHSRWDRHSLSLPGRLCMADIAPSRSRVFSSFRLSSFYSYALYSTGSLVATTHIQHLFKLLYSLLELPPPRPHSSLRPLLCLASPPLPARTRTCIHRTNSTVPAFRAHRSSYASQTDIGFWLLAPAPAPASTARIRARNAHAIAIGRQCLITI